MPAPQSQSRDELTTQIREVAKAVADAVNCLNHCRGYEDLKVLYDAYDTTDSYFKLYDLLRDYVTAAQIYYPDDAFRVQTYPRPMPTEDEICIAHDILGDDLPDLMMLYGGTMRLHHTMLKMAWEHMQGMHTETEPDAADDITHYQLYHLLRLELGLPNDAATMAPLVDVPEINYHSVDRAAALEEIINTMALLKDLAESSLTKYRGPKKEAPSAAFSEASAAIQEQIQTALESATSHIMRQSGLEPHVVIQYVQISIEQQLKKAGAMAHHAHHFN